MQNERCCHQIKEKNLKSRNEREFEKENDTHECVASHVGLSERAKEADREKVDQSTAAELRWFERIVLTRPQK